jgi:hypothetical protein
MSQEHERKLARVCLHGESWPRADVVVEVPQDVADDQIKQVVNEVAEDIPKHEFEHFPEYVFDVGVTEIKVLDRTSEIHGQNIYRIRRTDSAGWELAWD